MNKYNKIGVVVFGILALYSVFLIINGGNPGGVLIVAIVGLVVSIGNHLASKK